MCAIYRDFHGKCQKGSLVNNNKQRTPSSQQMYHSVEEGELNYAYHLDKILSHVIHLFTQPYQLYHPELAGSSTMKAIQPKALNTNSKSWTLNFILQFEYCCFLILVL